MSHLPPLVREDRVVFTDKTDSDKALLLNCRGIVMDLFGSVPHKPGHFMVNFGQFGSQPCLPGQLAAVPPRHPAEG